MSKEEIDAHVVKLRSREREPGAGERQKQGVDGRKSGRERKKRYIQRRIEREITEEQFSEIERRYRADPKRMGIHREIAEALGLKPWLVWNTIALVQKEYVEELQSESGKDPENTGESHEPESGT